MTTTRTDQAAFLRHRWETPMTTTPPAEGNEPRECGARHPGTRLPCVLPTGHQDVHTFEATDRPSPPVPAAEDDAVEQAARALHDEGVWCGECEFDGWDSCPECRRVCLTAARAALDAAGVGDLTAAEMAAQFAYAERAGRVAAEQYRPTSPPEGTTEPRCPCGSDYEHALHTFATPEASNGGVCWGRPVSPAPAAEGCPECGDGPGCRCGVDWTAAEDDAVERAARAIDRLAGWQHLRKYAGMTPEWSDALRDAMARAVLAALHSEPAQVSAEEVRDRIADEVDQDTTLFADLERLCEEGAANPSTLADKVQDFMVARIRLTTPTEGGAS